MTGQRRFLRELAAQWRREIRLLAVLARTGPAETRATIRAHDEAVTNILPDSPSAPPELRDALDELFSKHRTLVEQIGAHLVETVNADAPDHEQLMEWARQDGVAVDRLTSVERALRGPRSDRAQDLRKRSQRLLERDVHPVRPAFLGPRGNIGGGEGGGGGGGGTPPKGPINVGPGHVPGTLRQYGDEGERWALAAVVGALMNLHDAARDAAIGEIEALLSRFEGSPVDKALAHAAPARMRDLDDEERIDELSGLLHVSQYSDAFGFDLIGWQPSSSNGKGQAMCLEVKSSGGQGFHLSQRQWSVAEEFHRNNAGELYAVLVVRRSRAGGVPAAMDLLSDPVALVDAGHLRKEDDGYQIDYRTRVP